MERGKRHIFVEHRIAIMHDLECWAFLTCVKQSKFITTPITILCYLECRTRAIVGDVHLGTNKKFVINRGNILYHFV